MIARIGAGLLVGSLALAAGCRKQPDPTPSNYYTGPLTMKKMQPNSGNATTNDK